MGISSPSGVADNSISTLKLQDGAATADKCGAGVFRRIATTTLSAAATSISFTGLSMDGKSYYIAFQGVRNGGAESLIYIYFNGDTTGANYETIRLYGNGSSAGSSDLAYPLLCYFNTPDTTAAFATLRKLSGKSPFVMVQSGIGTNLAAYDNFAVNWSGGASDVTSITLTADAANGLGIGTIVSLYQID